MRRARRSPVTAPSARRHHARRSAGACCAVLLFLLTACGSSGKELRDPPPGATSPLPTTSTTQPVTALPAVFTVSSPAFSPGTELPTRYTCAGEGLSLPLEWTAVPPDTAELALVISDTTAGFEVLWTVTGIDATSVGAIEDSVPPGGVEGPNHTGATGWLAPCPPAGESHQLDITLYSLTEPVALTGDLTALEVVGALDTTPGSRTALTARVTAGTEPTTSG